MAIAIIEHETSGAETHNGIDGDTELVYHVLEAPSAIAARNLARATAPLVLPESGFIRRSIVTTPIGAGIYSSKIKYGLIENKIRLSIDTTAEKIKVTKSLRSAANFKVRGLIEDFSTLNGVVDANQTTIVVNNSLTAIYGLPFLVVVDEEVMLATSTPDGGFTLNVDRGMNGTAQAVHLDGATATILPPAQNFGGLVNVDKERVNGADWWASGMKLTLQWSSKWGILDPRYVELVESMGGKVNDADIELIARGQAFLFHKGEMVCQGGTFDEGSDDVANISLKFEVSRSALIAVGERDGTNSTWKSKIFKEGWHLGWLRTVQAVTGFTQHEVPDSFHVDQLGEYDDFSQLGIFTRLQEEKLGILPGGGGDDDDDDDDEDDEDE